VNEISNLSTGIVDLPTLDELADRIRGMVTTARTCIIEIGRELIAAKARTGHGGWLKWIEAEFGWADETARKYMRVAEAFQIPTTLGFDGITIDAVALYTLAKPDVPVAARAEAVVRAKTGEEITLAKARKMAEAAKAEAKRELRAEYQDKRDAANAAQKEAIDKLTQRFSTNKERLQFEINKLKEGKKQPGVPEAIAMFCKILGKTKLSEGQYRLLAQILGTSVNDGKTIHSPISDEQARKDDAALKVSGPAVRALEYFPTAPTPAEVWASLVPAQAANARKNAAAAADWLAEFNRLAAGEG
jgi:Protein of unknown function (DUF3102)